eukprot:4617489-Pyramimonas_sp.AAC.1
MPLAGAARLQEAPRAPRPRPEASVDARSTPGEPEFDVHCTLGRHSPSSPPPLAPIPALSSGPLDNRATFPR